MDRRIGSGSGVPPATDHQWTSRGSSSTWSYIRMPRRCFQGRVVYSSSNTSSDPVSHIGAYSIHELPSSQIRSISVSDVVDGSAFPNSEPCRNMCSIVARPLVSVNGKRASLSSTNLSSTNLPSTNLSTPTCPGVTMNVSELLLEVYARIPPLVGEAVDGLDDAQLTWQPSPGANTIAWLVWHLTRVQDHHVAEILEKEQVWVSAGWATRCGLEPDPSNTGYGHLPTDVLSVRPDGHRVLVEYLDAVDQRTSTMISGLADADLDKVVDRRWDPPVTLGVRLVSIADDCLQHAGQAAYVRGLLDG